MTLSDRLARSGPPWQNVAFWLIPCAIFLFLLTFFSANKEVGSDPKLTLLVSQSILENGTIRLDNYQDDQLLEFPFEDYVQRLGLVVERGGHYYAYFPAGPSFLSLPFVWLSTLLGGDMRTADNFQLQILLAASSVVAVFFLLYRTGVYLVGRQASLIISLFAVLGSSLSSTLGTALWTLNFSTLFIALVLLLIVRDTAGRAFNPYLLGLLLFLCYFVRASTAVFIAPVLGYLFWQRRRLFWPTAVTAFILLLLFLLWSRYEYGQWLPDYYSLARLQQERMPAWLGILGNLVSPSRGIFIFSPLFLLLFPGLLLTWRALFRQPLFWLCVVWLALQFLLLARAVVWWGGVSYGPRLLADALPGFVLLLFLIWQEASQRTTIAQQRAAIALFLLLGAVSTAIHITGLYRPATIRWNLFVEPVPTRASGPFGDLFDWTIMQSLASNEMLCAMEEEKALAYLAVDEELVPYQMGGVHTTGDRLMDITTVREALKTAAAGEEVVISMAPAVPGAAPPSTAYRAYLPAVSRGGQAALYIGWQDPGIAGMPRASTCPQSTIVLLMAGEPLAEAEYWLNITAASTVSQPVIIAINQTPIAEATWPASPSTLSFPFPAHLLQPGGYNMITFHFPAATIAPPWIDSLRLQFDDRHLALSLHDLSITRSSPSTPPPGPPPAAYP